MSEAGLIHLLDFRTSRHIDTVNDFLDDQVREVHVDLRYDLLCLKVIDREPEMLSAYVTICSLHNLRKDEWSLGAVVVFELDSLIENSPGLILRNHFAFIVCRNSSRDFEREEFNSGLLWADHPIGIGVKYRNSCHSWKKVLSTARKKSPVLLLEVLYLSNWQEWLLVFALPIWTLNESNLRALIGAQLLNFLPKL